MIREQPYFMQNRDWYVTPEDQGIDDYFFDDGRGYHIRDDAPEEAKRSYEEFYADAVAEVDGREIPVF